VREGTVLIVRCQKTNILTCVDSQGIHFVDPYRCTEIKVIGSHDSLFESFFHDDWKMVGIGNDVYMPVLRSSQKFDGVNKLRGPRLHIVRKGDSTRDETIGASNLLKSILQRGPISVLSQTVKEK
jgi:hypothetical protein